MNILLAAWLLVFSVTHDGKVIWTDKIAASPWDCVRYAGDYGDGVRATCSSRKGIRSLRKNGV